jgi:hypothetical protein
MELLGDGFGGIVASGRLSACNHLPLERRQLCLTCSTAVRPLAPVEDRCDRLVAAASGHLADPAVVCGLAATDCGAEL